MLSNIRIGSKIYILGFTQFLLMVIIGGISISQMAKIGNELMDIAENDIPLANALTKITEHQLAQTILFERALYQSSLASQNISGANQHYIEITERIHPLTTIIQNELSDTLMFVDKAISHIHSPEAKQEFTLVLSKLKKIEDHYADVVGQIEHVLTMTSSASLEEIAYESSQIESMQEVLQEETILLLNDIQAFTLRASIEAEQHEQAGIMWIIIWLAIALTVGATLPYVIGRAITSPVNQLASRLKEISSGDGDLTVVINESAKDETGDVAKAFNKFVGTLRILIDNTNAQADVLGDSSEIAMKAMRDTVVSVDKQRIETEMVVTAVTEMSMSSQDVAASADSASAITLKVKERVDTGKQTAFETQTIIKQLASEVTEASNVIESLVSETNNIGSVLESIQGIAEQTNLLALNAAIEAARAGETGRGFAVVADEVRTLAQRTQSSTLDIQSLLIRLKSEANNAVSSMSKGSESANECLQKSAQTTQTFEEASLAVDEITDMNVHIANAAQEQSLVSEQISKNLNNISDLANISAEGAKATSSANTTIAKSVVSLHKNLNVFIV